MQYLHNQGQNKGQEPKGASKMTIKIGRREYKVEGVRNAVNKWGQPQVWTDLKGKKGAEVVLVETTTKTGIVAKLIHLGRMTPGETIDPSMIKR